MTTITKPKPWNALRRRYGDTVSILRALDVDDDVRVLVVGDGANGSYDWAIEKKGSVEKHSDVGYGIADVALRDGLIEYYGLPETVARSEKQAAFERIIQVQPPYDKRHPDPSKNYGIHGMTLRFILKGPKGATQFIFYTGQHLKHVADELAAKQNGSRFNRFHGMGADIGYHAYTPQYEGQTPMEKCDILGCDCYYDGSSLRAREFEDEFLQRGEEAVWPMLEDEYRRRFEEKSDG